MDRNSIQQLPDKKCLIVVDNAHQRDDLPLIVQILNERKMETKILLSSRPQRLNNTIGILTEYGINIRDIITLPELENLLDQEMEELASTILDNKYRIYLESLLKVAEDSPLVLTIGSRLLNEEGIDPKLLGIHTEFIQTVFNRFQEVIIGDINGIADTQKCKDLLSLISAVSPFKPQNELFQELASKFLDIDTTELVDMISELENSGILIRSGNSLRITPDLLSDHILYKSCITHQGNSSITANKRCLPKLTLFYIKKGFCHFQTF